MTKYIGAHVSDSAEHHHIHYHSEQWLYDIPQRPKDRLFILYYNITFDEQFYQVSVTPYLFKIYAP